MKFEWVTFRVRDLEKSLVFYRDLLGFPVSERFGPPSHEIVMLGDADSAKVELIAGDAVPDCPGEGVSIGVTPPDMTALLKKLEKAGVLIPAPFSPNPSLRFYFIKDPDGYTVQLVEHL